MSRQANELSLLMVMMVLAVVEVILVFLLKIRFFGVTLGRQIWILGVALVESIDKRLLLCLGSMCNR